MKVIVHVDSGAVEIGQSVRAAVHLAGGRLTERATRADVAIACARTYRRAKPPDHGRVKLAVARGAELERRSAIRRGFDDALRPDPKVLVARFRTWLARATCTAEIVIEAEVIRIDGTPVTLTPIEHRLLARLHASRGGRVAKGTLLADVWGFPEKADVDTDRVAAHVCNVNRKLSPFGIRIDGNKRGWCIP